MRNLPPMQVNQPRQNSHHDFLTIFLIHSLIPNRVYQSPTPTILHDKVDFLLIFIVLKQLQQIWVVKFPQNLYFIFEVEKVLW